MPRMELCAVLTGAQLTRLLEQELTLPISQSVPSGLTQPRCCPGYNLSHAI